MELIKKICVLDVININFVVLRVNGIQLTAKVKLTT
jgi:hypothetical protein